MILFHVSVEFWAHGFQLEAKRNTYMTSMWGTLHSTLGSLWSAETLNVILVKQGGKKIIKAL